MKKSLKGFAIGVVVGALLMVSTFAVASSVNQFILARADYPVYVNNVLYEPAYLDLELPMMKYKGYTYAPLRAVSELLGVQIDWDEVLLRVDITREQPSAGNAAFRNIVVSGTQGTYTVTGEARVFEATYQYEVSDGHHVFMEGFGTASTGGPDWGTFTLEVIIAPEDLPTNGTLTLFLFEESAKDGSIINELAVVLEVFP